MKIKKAAPSPTKFTASTGGDPVATLHHFYIFVKVFIARWGWIVGRCA